MIAIPLYSKSCSDFSTNGLCLIQPIECTVEETANGLYELTMELPIEEDGRFSLVQPGAIVKVPTPARESPLYELEAVTQQVTTTTVTRRIYKVNVSRARLRQKASSSGKTLSKHKKGVEVTLLDGSGSTWWKVSILKGGATGYMLASDLRYSRTVTDRITKTRPVTQNGIEVQVARDQLFRIYSVETDTEQGTLTARALHIFYDLRFDFLNATYAPQNVAANTAANFCFQNLRYAPEHSLYTQGMTPPVSGEYSWKNFTEILLDPDEGIVGQARGQLFRDNFDIYLMSDEARDMGVTVRRGKNLLGVTVTTDDSEVVTRIQPCGKDNEINGNLWLENSACVDSPKIDDYPVIRAQKIDYDITFDPSASDPKEGTYTNKTAARNALRAAAQADFDAGCDEPSYGMEVDFVLLENTAEYQDYARLQAVHLFDTVTVIDELIGLTAKLRVTAYTWNVLSEQYESVTLGDIQDMRQTTYSFNLAGGSVSGDKLQHGTGSTGTSDLANGAVTTDKLANGAVTTAKLSDAAKAAPWPVGSVYANTGATPNMPGTWTSIGTASIGSVSVTYWQRTA